MILLLTLTRRVSSNDGSKKKYEMVQLDVVQFLQKDIITTSGLYYNDVKPDATLYWDEIFKDDFWSQ